jgi:hypothetical protein
LEAEIRSFGDEAARLKRLTLQMRLREKRAREEQYRREEAAAGEDPDTYAPGNPDSDDPVEQVSISVIGEGLIFLRGPTKGINIIRTMIRQIEDAARETRNGLHVTRRKKVRHALMPLLAEVDELQNTTGEVSAQIRGLRGILDSEKVAGLARDVALGIREWPDQDSPFTMEVDGHRLNVWVETEPSLRYRFASPDTEEESQQEGHWQEAYRSRLRTLEEFCERCGGIVFPGSAGKAWIELEHDLRSLGQSAEEDKAPFLIDNVAQLQEAVEKAGDLARFTRTVSSEIEDLAGELRCELQRSELDVLALYKKWRTLRKRVDQVFQPAQLKDIREESETVEDAMRELIKAESERHTAVRAEEQARRPQSGEGCRMVPATDCPLAWFEKSPSQLRSPERGTTDAPAVWRP